MRKVLTIIALIAVNAICFGQENSNENITGFSSDLGAADYTFNVGTSVGSSLNNSYWFNNYFSPSAKFDLTKKFSVVAGVGVSYSQFHNVLMLDNEYNLQKTNANITSIFTYAGGIYKLNNKVNLNATVLFDENIMTSPETPVALQKQYKDVSLGLNYNVTKYISINAQMHISDRPVNRYSNSFNSFGASSPFGYTPIF